MTVDDTTDEARAESSSLGLRPLNFMSWFFPLFWLVFLVYPLAGSIQQDGSQRIWGVSLTVLFAAVFYTGMIAGGIGLGTFARTKRNPHARRTRQALIVVNASIVGLIVITVAAVPIVGENALAFLAYISVLSVVSVQKVVPGLIIAASTLIVAEVAQRLVPGWTHDWSSTFGISISGFAMVMALMAGDRTRAARAAEEENRRLEREAERLRVSQVVHDVLGHSLTVIALKAQLAAKLEAAGSPEAARHIAEIEELARGALADVRTTVQGTRTISLAEELVEATRALRAADILVEAPTSVDTVDPRLRELFAWSLREGSTNILRHARARRVTITLERERLTMSNDNGRRDDPAHPVTELNLGEVGAGSGLQGLRSRARALGGSLRTQQTDAGFELIVVGPDADLARPREDAGGGELDAGDADLNVERGEIGDDAAHR
ncbi:sensor histidine kinase [Brevibacterium sp. H602]|uniref:sensor histidine kinase n=1 Tax=unclassified Brevibacterium TaxID=2614124 RepID=UPI00397DEC80